MINCAESSSSGGDNAVVGSPWPQINHSEKVLMPPLSDLSASEVEESFI